MNPKDYVLNVVDGDRGKDWILPKLPKTAKSKALPTIVSKKASSPPVMDQGPIGSCVGCSGYSVYGQRLTDTLLSAMWIYKNGKLLDEIEGENYSGTTITGACNALLQKGCCLSSYWPYVGSEDTQPFQGAEEDAASRKIFAFYKIGVDRVEEIKELLQTKNLWIAISVYNKFFSPDENGKISIDNYFEGTPSGGHALSITGYVQEDNKLWYEVQNSWGQRWGKDGYCYLDAEIVDRATYGAGVYCLITQEDEAKRLEDAKKEEENRKPAPVAKEKLFVRLLRWLKNLLGISR